MTVHALQTWTFQKFSSSNNQQNLWSVNTKIKNIALFESKNLFAFQYFISTRIDDIHEKFCKDILVL